MDDNTGDLLVGSFSVCSAEGIDDEVLAVFRDDMFHSRQAPAAEYEHMISPNGPFVDAAGVPGTRPRDRRPA
jgi:hypothetical protein